MSHTPGPWSSEGFDVGDMAEMLYLTQDSDHYKEPIRICLIAGHEWKVPKGKRDERCYLTKSSIADAKLIAAAPELLQALVFCLEFLEANDDGEDDVVERIKAAKAAIAKAIGN
jgi:hypothetical protein